MVGITAIGLPTAGKIKNQGRVGLCQNWVKYPEKYRTLVSVVSNMPSKLSLRITTCARAMRCSNSSKVNCR
jgi:hypothetical protein